MPCRISSSLRLWAQYDHRFMERSHTDTRTWFAHQQKGKLPPSQGTLDLHNPIWISPGAKRNDWPCTVPNNSPTKNPTPSVPITNPTKLAPIIINTFPTAPSAAACLYHTLCPYYIQKLVSEMGVEMVVSSSVNEKFGKNRDDRWRNWQLHVDREHQENKRGLIKPRLTLGDGYGFENKIPTTSTPDNQRRCHGSHSPCRYWQIHKP